MSDDLRKRLREIDPMGSGVPTESVTSESSRRLLEEIMSTELRDDTTAKDERSRVPWYLGAAAALALVIGAFAVFSGGSQPQGPPLELALGSSNSLGSCIQFSVDILADMPLAFEGTAVSVTDDRVTLDVDKWYKGGDATQVALAPGPGSPALIDGVTFVEGEAYLITATEGTVNSCGFSGPATAELRAAFEQAFPGN